MMQDNFLSGAYTPIDVETDQQELEVIGHIPNNICGTFYRNGPNPHFKSYHNYHLFDGDGMIHAFHINNGKVKYRNKWIKTEKFIIESKIGKAIFGGILDFKGNNLSIETVNKGYNTSNTNVVYYNGQLISLWEFGSPYLINPKSLDTIGIANHITEHHLGAFTAHPKIDPDTSEMISVSYNGYSKMPACYLNIFKKDKNYSKLIEVPYRSMIHDVAITKNYVVIPVLPAVLDFSTTSQALVNWKPERSSYISIHHRDVNSSFSHFIKVDTCYIYHFVNAYEDNENNIVVDAIVHDVVPLFFRNSKQQLIHPKYGKLIRWIFNLNSNSYKEEVIDQSVYYHFPQCDHRFLGKEYNIFYGYAQNKNVHQLKTINLKNKMHKIYTAPPTYYLGEPYFVPKLYESHEGEGYLFVVSTSYEKNESKLLVFDSENIDKPLAEVKTPFRIPIGFHGLWVS